MAFTGRRVLVGGVMLWFAAMAHAQINPGGNDKPDGPTLDRLFAVFKSLVNRGNYQKMGFEVEKELAAAKPGTPIRLFIIRPDQLLAFTDATDPATVIEDAKQWVYPVLVGTDVRSGATVARQGTEGFWKLISAGDQGLARSIFQERQDDSTRTPQKPVERYFLVDTQAGNRKFLAYRSDGLAPTQLPGNGQLRFTWLGDVPDGQDKRGSAEKALVYLANQLKKRGRGPG
jgi:hypothetical protein